MQTTGLIFKSNIVMDRKHMRPILRLLVQVLLLSLAILPAGYGFADNFETPALPPAQKTQETHDVVIELEKKMPPADTNAGEKPKTPQASSSYEDLKDPFASTGQESPAISDPLEGYNRFMFSVNDSIGKYFFEPLARSYAKFFSEDTRVGVKHILSNLSEPGRFVSSLFQGSVDKSLTTAGRFIINSTMGVGGMFDVAGQHYGLHSANEDFDQALGSYHIPTGPYLVLPFFGPSYARNVVGRMVDSFLSPTTYFAPFAASTGIAFEDQLNAFSFNVDAMKDFEENTVDPYMSMQHFYTQYRERLLKE